MPDDKILQIIIRAKDEATKTLKKVDAEIKHQESKWAKMSKAMAHAGKTVTIASTAIAGALASTLPAWEETRKAQIAFENTVKHMPQLAKMNTQAWYQWVSAMEMKLAIDDAEINQMASMLGTYGMTEDQMKKMIPVIVDLSRKYGIDLASATKMVGYALQGNTGILKRYGITLDLSAAKTKEGIDTNKAYELTLQQLTQAVGGYSQALDKEGMLATERFKLALGNLRENIGQVVYKAITPLLEKLSDLAVRFNNMSPTISKVVAQVGLFASALGMVAGPLMTVIGNMKQLATVVTNFAKANPWVLIITSLVALGITLYKTNEDFRNFVNSLIARAKKGIDYIHNNWGKIADTVKRTFERVKQTVLTILQPVLDLVKVLFGEVVSWTQENWPLIQKTIQTVMNAIQTVIQTVLGIIRAFWEKHGETIKKNTQLVWDSIKLIVETALKTILGIIKAIMQAINGDWKGAWETVKATLKNVATALVQIAKNLWTAIVNGIKAVGPELLNAVKSIAQAIKDLFVNLAKEALQWGKNLIKNFIKGIKSMIGALEDEAEGAADTVGSYLGIHSPAEKGPMSDADKWMPNLIKMMSVQLRVEADKKLKPAVERVAKIIKLPVEPIAPKLPMAPTTPMTRITPTITPQPVATRRTTETNTGELANAVYQAVVRGMETTRTTGATKGEIVLQIDGQTFARLIYDYLLAESKRRGVEVVPV